MKGIRFINLLQYSLDVLKIYFNEDLDIVVESNDNNLSVYIYTKKNKEVS